jgi:hypothetical protein
MSWKPALDPAVDLKALPLTPEEGFVASRLDGRMDVREVTLATGLGTERVQAALAHLVALRAVAPMEAEADGEDEASEAQGTHRKLFENALHALPVEERIAKAKGAREPELSALCFDPLPQVVQSLLTNPSVGLVHARLIAAHHRTAQGLDPLLAEPQFARDPGVRRFLLRNPQLQPAHARRLYAHARLMDQFKLVTSRETTDQVRRTARELLRQRFATGATPEERVEVIFKTEGRCLTSLVGLTFDAKTTALLASRPYASTLLVQNLARFSATPPPVLLQLARQELVKRNPSLKAMVERHPNFP